MYRALDEFQHSSMIALQPAFLSLLSITVVTASVFQRDGSASTDVTPESFVAEAFDYLIVGKDPNVVHNV